MLFFYKLKVFFTLILFFRKNRLEFIFKIYFLKFGYLNNACVSLHKQIHTVLLGPFQELMVLHFSVSYPRSSWLFGRRPYILFFFSFFLIICESWFTTFYFSIHFPIATFKKNQPFWYICQDRILSLFWTLLPDPVSLIPT